MHALAEERSLAYHRRVADLLPTRPDLRAAARARACRWAEGEGRSAPYAAEWLALLDGPAERLAQVLVDPGQHARDLRQSTPFAGALDPRERWRLWREVRERWEAR
jgi:hypothetical protein